MKGNISLNLKTIKNSLLILSSSYLTLTALISLFFITSILFSNLGIDFIAAITLVVSTFVVLTTILINVRLILNKRWFSQKYLLTNLVICIIQSVSFFSDGLNYKYIQGFEWVGYLHYDTISGKWDSGAFFSKLVFEFVLNFKSAKGVMIGTNFITVLLSFYYYYLFKKIKTDQKTKTHEV